MLGDWLNVIHIPQYEDIQISLFHYVALTKGTYLCLETRGKGARKVDNIMLVVELPLLDDEHDIIPPTPVDAETLWGVDKFPTLHMTQDHYYRAYCCQVMFDSALLLV